MKKILTSLILTLPAVSALLAQTATLTPLTAFDGNAQGFNFSAPLVFGADGNLYGTAQSGPANVAANSGTAFRVSTSGAYALVHQFVAAPDETSPQFPYAPLTPQADGSFYGTTAQGGSGVGGTVFRIDAAGGFTVLANFNASNPTPHSLYSGVTVGQGGVLFGAAAMGGPNPSGADGAVYRLNADGSGVTAIHQFDRSIDGTGEPEGAPTQLADGRLFGVTHGIEDGAHQAAIYSLNADGSGFQVVHSFSYSMHNYFNNTLLLAGDGNLYGATLGSGTAGSDDISGTIYRLAPGGAFTVLHTFNSSGDGSYPNPQLIQAADGLIYGTTRGGGPHNGGTVFRIAPDGSGFETIYAFTSDAPLGEPVAGLAQGADGSFYGLTDRPLAVFKLSVRAATDGPTLNVIAQPAIASYGQAPGKFKILRTGDVSQPLTISVKIHGTDANGVDYNAVASQATFPAGKTKAKVKIFPTAAARAGNVKLKLLPGAGYTVGPEKKATVTIVP